MSLRHIFDRVVRRWACRVGLHAAWFAYAPRGASYEPDVFCIGCAAAGLTPPAWARLACRLGIHRGQRLTAPPTWKRGDPFHRGKFCIWCATRLDESHPASRSVASSGVQRGR